MKSKRKDTNVVPAKDRSVYMPPFTRICAQFGLFPNAKRDMPVTIPSAFFRFLLGDIVRQQPFDAAAYLADNPDVAQALEAGVIVSAQEHYVRSGYFEGRTHYPSKFNESWYLLNNPDVAEAVKAGIFKTGAEHFIRAGRREGRPSCASAGVAKAAWDAALK